MEITLTFTPEEFKEHQALLEKGKAYDKILKQRDEVDTKFKELQKAIRKAGLGITVSISGGRPDTYTLKKMDKETKEFWENNYPDHCVLRSYQE